MAFLLQGPQLRRPIQPIDTQSSRPPPADSGSGLRLSPSRSLSEKLSKMGFMHKLQKKASRLSLFDIDRSISIPTTTTVCDGPASAPPTATAPSTPRPHRPVRRASTATLITTFTRSRTPDPEATLDSRTSPVFTPVPIGFQQLQPVEYIAPRPRRTRSLGFDTLRRRVSVIMSPTSTTTQLPGGAEPLSPRMGPDGALLPPGLLDWHGNPVSPEELAHSLVSDVPLARPTADRTFPRSRPMTSFNVAPSLPPGAAEPVIGHVVFEKRNTNSCSTSRNNSGSSRCRQPDHVEQLKDADADDFLFTPPRTLHSRSNSLSAADAFALSPDNPSRPRQLPSRPRSPFARMSARLSGVGSSSFLVSPEFMFYSPLLPLSLLSSFCWSLVVSERTHTGRESGRSNAECLIEA